MSSENAVLLKFSHNFIMLVLSFLLLALVCPATGKGQRAQNPSLERLESQIGNKSATDATYKELETLIEAEPSNAKARLLLASCYDQLGLPELALEQYQLAYQAAPGNPATVAAFFNAQLKALHTAEAVKVLNEANKQYLRSPELLNFVSNYIFNNNEIEMARLLYRRALRSKDIPIGFASALANIESKRNNYQAALQLATEDLHKNRDLAVALEIKGLALSHLGNFSEAVEPLKLAFPLNPGSVEIATAYALSLIWTGQYSSALAPALVPLAYARTEQDATMAKTLLISILKKVKNSDLGPQYNSIATQLPIKQRAQFYFALAQVFDVCNMADQAIEQYKNGLAIEANNAEGWYKLANDLETKSHDYQQALLCYRKAQVLLPDNQLVKQRTWRLEDRLSTQSNDWSWQLKDWLEGLSERSAPKRRV